MKSADTYSYPLLAPEHKSGLFASDPTELSTEDRVKYLRNLTNKIQSPNGNELILSDKS